MSRIDIMIKYTVERLPASSRGASGKDVAGCGLAVVFTMGQDYAAPHTSAPSGQWFFTASRRQRGDLSGVGENDGEPGEEQNDGDDRQGEADPSDDHAGQRQTAP